MRCLVVIASLALLSVACAVPADVAAGFRPGQTENIIIHPNHPQQTDAAFTVIDESGAFVQAHHPTSALHVPFSAYDVANVAAQLLGVTPLHHSSQSAASALFSVKPNLFVRPRANLLLTIDGVGRDTVRALNLPALSSRASIPYVPLAQVFYPTTPENLAVALASGRAPSLLFQNTPRLSDVMADAFGGESLFVSASAKHSIADAFTPRLRNSRTHIVTLDSISEISMNKMIAELARHFEQSEGLVKSLRSSGLQVTISGDVATIVVAGTPVNFDLRNEADATLFAELQFLANLPSGMAREYPNAVNDDVPDVYAITVSSLRNVAAQYGAGSAQFEAAVRLVDATVPYILQQFSAIYPQRFVAQLVLSGSIVANPTLDGALSAANAVLQKHGLVAASVSITGPSNRAELSRVCDELNKELNQLQFSAVCPTLSLEHSARFRALADPVVGNTTNPNLGLYYSRDVYQIAMWLGIGLAFVLLTVVYAIIYMDLKRDTLLYSKFNPNWSQRKNN